MSTETEDMGRAMDAKTLDMGIPETREQYCERVREERCEEAYEILSDLVSMDSEKWAIGGGPNWKAREEAIWKRARELFEP